MSRRGGVRHGFIIRQYDASYCCHDRLFYIVSRFSREMLFFDFDRGTTPRILYVFVFVSSLIVGCITDLMFEDNYLLSGYFHHEMMIIIVSLMEK